MRRGRDGADNSAYAAVAAVAGERQERHELMKHMCEGGSHSVLATEVSYKHEFA